MGTYESEARYHLEKIQHFHSHAGLAGYSQAVLHYSKLSELLRRASKSKNNRNDAVVIQGFIQSAEPLIEEMKNRRENEGGPKG